MEELPYELAQYIAKGRETIREANHADFKPTFERELEAAAKTAKIRYELGLKFMAEIAEHDLARCKKLYTLRNGSSYGAEELCEIHVQAHGFVVVPQYVGMVEEVSALKKVLA